jgi:hypothetical protein
LSDVRDLLREVFGVLKGIAMASVMVAETSMHRLSLS